MHFLLYDVQKQAKLIDMDIQNSSVLFLGKNSLSCMCMICTHFCFYAEFQ